MAAAPRPIEVTRAQEQDTSWEMAVSSATGPAAEMVTRLVGFRENAGSEVVRTEGATSTVTVIVSFGEKLEVRASDGSDRPYLSFVAGLQPGPAVTRHPGELQCIQLDLPPLAAYQLFGVPGAHLAGAVTALDAVVPALGGEQISDQLASTDDWGVRLGLVDRVLNRLAVEGRPPDPVVDWAWTRLTGSAGNVRIADLVRESGVSHGHLTRRFRQQVGISPKAAANLLRHARATALLSTGRWSPADVAASCGYADQSHLTREMGRLAGTTPAALRHPRTG